MATNETTAEWNERRAKAWLASPKTLDDYWRSQADWYQARLFEAWTALRGQSKGLQRQRRLIKRLQATNARLLAERGDFEIMLARSRAKERGATPLEVERAVQQLGRGPGGGSGG